MKNRIIENNRTKLQILGFIITVIGLFIIVHSIRYQFFNLFTQRAYLWNINFIATIGILLLIISGTVSFQKENICWLILPILSLPFPLYYSITSGSGLGFFVVFSSKVILALYLLYVELPSQYRTTLLRSFLILLNILMIIMIFRAIIDVLTDRSIAKWLCTFMTADAGFYEFAYPVNRGYKRLYSFFGFPLTNATLINFTYVLNITWNEKQRPIIPSWLCCLLFLPGIVCCGSKTGITVALLITLIAYYKNLKLLLLALVAILLTLVSGVASNLIDRILNTSLFTGRIEALLLLLSDKEHPIYLFKGNGQTYRIVALEFPLINLAVTYGLVFALFIIGIVAIYVTIKLLHKGTIHNLLLWCLCYAETNTFFSGFGIGQDETLIFCFLTMILLNIIFTTAKEESP